MEADSTPKKLPAIAPISWRAYEYTHSEKGAEWYWALGLIAVAASAMALFFNNVLFAIMILLLAFVLAIFAARKPDLITFTITQRGVRVGNTFYPFKELDSFAIEELSENHTPKLILHSSKIFVPDLFIPLEGVDPDEVHEFMRSFLPEEDHVEPLIHKVMEYFGF